MKKLETVFTKRGFLCEMIEESTHTYIFKKTRSLNTNYTTYEVFEKRVSPEKERDGILYLESEVFPHDEDFGKWAFACSTLERAKERQQELEERVENRPRRLKLVTN